jgi:arsenate reductase (thioredoxin)
MEDFLAIVQALSDQNRLRIVMALQKQELCVCQVVELLGLAASTVSKHLSILRQARLIKGRKEGRWMYYRLPEEAAESVSEAISWVCRSLADDVTIKQDRLSLKQILETPAEQLCKRKDRLRVLFLCTGNSCRSQMAEGWAHHLHEERLESFSAGTEAKVLDLLAVKVMAEAGVDISGHHSKNVSEISDLGFDYVVTVCNHANETCPIIPGNAWVIHRSFDDPSCLGKGLSKKQILESYRRVRDEIREFVETLPAELEKHCHVAP